MRMQTYRIEDIIFNMINLIDINSNSPRVFELIRDRYRFVLHNSRNPNLWIINRNSLYNLWSNYIPIINNTKLDL